MTISFIYEWIKMCHLYNILYMYFMYIKLSKHKRKIFFVLFINVMCFDRTEEISSSHNTMF